MTVRELIEHLQTLDQDRNIFVLYDGVYPSEILFTEATSDDLVDVYPCPTDKGFIEVHPGDYIYKSW